MKVIVDLGPRMWEAVDSLADQLDLTNEEAIRRLMLCGANWLDERCSVFQAPEGLHEEVESQESS